MTGYFDWRNSSTLSKPRSWMKINGKIYAPATYVFVKLSSFGWMEGWVTTDSF